MSDLAVVPDDEIPHNEVSATFRNVIHFGIREQELIDRISQRRTIKTLFDAHNWCNYECMCGILSSHYEQRVKFCHPFCFSMQEKKYKA